MKITEITLLGGEKKAEICFPLKKYGKKQSGKEDIPARASSTKPLGTNRPPKHRTDHRANAGTPRAAAQRPAAALPKATRQASGGTGNLKPLEGHMLPAQAAALGARH